MFAGDNESICTCMDDLTPFTYPNSAAVVVEATGSPLASLAKALDAVMADTSEYCLLLSVAIIL